MLADEFGVSALPSYRRAGQTKHTVFHMDSENDPLQKSSAGWFAYARRSTVRSSAATGGARSAERHPSRLEDPIVSMSLGNVVSVVASVASAVLKDPRYLLLLAWPFLGLLLYRLGRPNLKRGRRWMLISSGISALLLIISFYWFGWIGGRTQDPEAVSANAPISNVSLDRIGQILSNPNGVQTSPVIKGLRNMRFFGSGKVIAMNAVGAVTLFGSNLGISCEYDQKYLGYLGTLARGDIVRFSGVLDESMGSAVILLYCRPEEPPTTH